MEIGFVGLGQVAAAIARNLLAAGHRLTVWNRSADRAVPPDIDRSGIARLAAADAGL